MANGHRMAIEANVKLAQMKLQQEAKQLEPKQQKQNSKNQLQHEIDDLEGITFSSDEEGAGAEKGQKKKKAKKTKKTKKTGKQE